MPPTWPRIQLLGSGFGQYGSTRNAGLWAFADSVPATIAPRTMSPRRHAKRIFIRSSPAGGGVSVYLGLRNRRLSLKKIEVATFVGLPDMLRKHRAVTAQITRRR